MKYAIFFFMMALSLTYLLWSMTAVDKWLLIWPILSSLMLMFAYLGNRPYLVCGKRHHGHVNAILCLINWPWLLLTLTVWFARSVLSREPRINRIGETNIYISRWPVIGVDTNEFDLVVDLTAELPRLYRVAVRYECLPNLDGIALANRQLQYLPTAEEKVLVHCAEGHGRSATFTSRLLSKMGIFETPRLAYEAILESRPGANVSSSQVEQIQ